MLQRLPKEIDPFRFAHNGLHLQGQLALSKMSRLAASLANDEGIVDVDMQFDIDELGTPYLAGRFKTTLTLICERCMEPMTINVDTECLLGFVKSEYKAEQLAEQYEPWFVENDEPVDPIRIVEDELILALPLVPRHDYSCLPEDAWYSGEKEGEAEKPASPFAVLSVLKSKK